MGAAGTWRLPASHGRAAIPGGFASAGLWQSVHIDDLRPSTVMVSDVTKLQGVTISQLFDPDSGPARTSRGVRGVWVAGWRPGCRGLWLAVGAGPARSRRPRPAPAPRQPLRGTPRAPLLLPKAMQEAVSPPGRVGLGAGGDGRECPWRTSVISCSSPQSAGQSDRFLLQNARGAVQRLISVPWASPWVPAAAGIRGTAASQGPTTARQHGPSARPCSGR